MDYSKIEKDFKSLEKNTEKLINKYNKSVDTIKKQEFAIDKIKNKLEELTSGNKTPASIKNLESELRKTEKELSNLEKQYNETITKINENNEEIVWAESFGNKQRAQTIKNENITLDDKSIEIATNLENMRDKAEKIKNSLQKSMSNIGNSKEIRELNSQLDILNDKLQQTKKEANQTKNEIENAFNKRNFNLGGIGKGVDEIKNKVDKFGKRLSRLVGTVLIFNLMRNSLTALRNNFVSLLTKNEDFSSSLNQIKANLMTAFTPIYTACLPAINALMNSLSRLTGTIAMFISGLFGTSLEDAKNQAKGLSKALDKTSKSGEKASGSLASFDNLEVINENNGSGGDSNNAADTGINYDGEIQYSQSLLETLNKIKDFVSQNTDEIIASIFGITAALIALKIFGIDPIKSLGIGLLIGGLVFAIEGLIGFLDDPSFENFGKVIQGIGIAITGLGTIILGLPAIITGVIILIVGTIIKHWNQIKLFFERIIDWLTGKSEFVHSKFGDTIGGIYDMFVNNIQKILNIFDTIFTNMKKNFDFIIDFIRNVFAGNWEGAWRDIKNIFSNIIDTLVNIIKNVLGIITNIVVTVASTIGNVIASVFKSIVNGILSTIEDIMNKPIKTVNKLISVINAVPGINIGKLPTFNLPRLATGAVIPPRQEFAAILGDQKHGTNIEAPLETIKQATREVMAEFMDKLSGLNAQEKEVVLRNFTIIAQFGNDTFKKIVIDSVRMAEQEMGKQLFVND